MRRDNVSGSGAARLSAAVVWSGGKDSTLALHRAAEAGLDIRVLFNLYDGESGRVRFHGVRRELVQAQADAIGADLVQLPTTARDYEAVFLAGLSLLRERGIRTLIFGNIHLADVRAWYEQRVRDAGFDHVEPLWGETPAGVVSSVVSLGYRAVLTGVDTTRVPHEWLGRELDAAFAAELAAADGIDAAGESGEYHTFVFDGPRFRSPVAVAHGVVMETATHALLDLVPVSQSR